MIILPKNNGLIIYGKLTYHAALLYLVEKFDLADQETHVPVAH